MIDDILEFNKKFVESKGYEKYITNKYPDKNSYSFLYGYPIDGIVTCCFGHQEW